MELTHKSVEFHGEPLAGALQAPASPTASGTSKAEAVPASTSSPRERS